VRRAAFGRASPPPRPALEPDNEHALVMRLLALTDQSADGLGLSARPAEEILPRLASEYDRMY